MPTTNAPQPRLTPVCAEAVTETDHAGCSGVPACRCRCHLPELDPRPEPLAGRLVAPESALALVRRLRDERRARREAGEPE
jgi:hypothetical protein